MRVHLINPSHVSFGVAVITPRWLYVLAAATPRVWGDPLIVDETLEPIDTATIQAGDVVGIGLHTGNALRGYEVGREARARGAWVVLEAFTLRFFRMRLMKLVAPTLLFAEMATWFGHASSKTVPMASQNVFTSEAVLGVINSCPLAGISCRVNGICGPRCRRCAAVPSTVPFARCGAQTVRNLASEVLTPSSGKWCNCAAWDFALSHWPTTIFIPLRCLISKRRLERPILTGFMSFKVCAKSALI